MIFNQTGIAFIPVLFWSVAVLFTGSIAVKKELIQVNLSGNKPLIQDAKALPTPLPNENNLVIPSPTPVPEKVQQAYIDPDPIIDCGPSQYSKQTVRVKSSECKNYTDCGLDGNTVYKLMLNSECNKLHADEITRSKSNNSQPTCQVYYSYFKITRTYPGLSKEDCAKLQYEAANPQANNTQPVYSPAPLPSVEPYQYSQEYLDSIDKFNQEISKPFQPTQFVAPTPKCYATWDEYLKAHPYYGNAPIYGNVNMSGPPPCD